MSLISRIGYLVSYIALLLLGTAITQASFGKPDFVLWLLAGVLFLIGLPLLLSDPLPRKLKLRILLSSSPIGTIGVATIMYGVMTLYTIFVPYLRNGDPTESWGLILLTSLAALVFGSVMFLVRPSLMDTTKKPTERQVR